MPLRLLKTKTTIPFHLENRLCTHWGFAVEKRFYTGGDNGSYILFKKVSTPPDKALEAAGLLRTIRASVNDPQPSNVVDLHKHKAEGLTAWQRKELDKRCDNIVSFFPDPYSVPKAVRTRLAILQQKLLPAEVTFVQEYMDENFPE